MDLDAHDRVAQGLRHYLASVAELVGVGCEACSIQLDQPVCAYIAVDQRLPTFPQRDVALLWDERHGWALAIETHGGSDLIVLGYLAGGLLPPPADVAAYLKRAVDGGGTGQSWPPAPSGLDAAEVLARSLTLGTPIAPPR